MINNDFPAKRKAETKKKIKQTVSLINKRKQHKGEKNVGQTEVKQSCTIPFNHCVHWRVFY